ncbi:MAG: PD-(D/E)XK nuclease family protein [Bacteroides sp.]|jgi:CRISPR/Cas system-associated exonuclease Cas4 (RecB family)|nr:PD-(D/E)XK nuclease family protein [Bacteroides sp.]
MQSFLEEVAVHVLEKYGSNTGDICLVTPNRRAGLFLRKHIAKRVTQPTWSPAFLSIEDFVNRISGYQVADNLSLMFHFYHVYQTIEGDKSDPLDEFLRWGSVLLRDFDEIDSSLENPDELFTYLVDIKYIETWNPEGLALSEFQKNYLSFFEKFKLYHKAFIAYLKEKNLAYQGMSYRKAATLLKENPRLFPYEKVIFAGFNALNQAEESIINSLVKDGLAEILSDSDPYYEDNPQHEAGHFIRRYRKKWDIPLNKEKASWFSTPKKIQVLGIARDLNQAQLAGNILDFHSDLVMDEQTAIVLANENLLLPVLNALPEKAAAINITMGYPLVKTNLFGFFEAIIQLYLTADRLKTTLEGKAPSFYYKDLLRLLSNPCAAILFEMHSGQANLDILIQKISLSNKIFYKYEDFTHLEEIETGFPDLFHFLSQNWLTALDEIIPVFRSLSDKLDQAFRQKADQAFGSLQQSPFFIDFEALYYFGRILSRMETVLDEGKTIRTLRIFWQIIKQSVSETRMAFSGEPVQGLQVMGVLETRNLDFKNIILLSANEDVLPKSKTSNSFIPFEVKRKFGLQVTADRDSVYAYHFYRLLQRADNVFLIYNTESGGMGSNEKSRFITQIEHEIKSYNPDIELHNQLVSLRPSIKTGTQEISIPKTPEILERLKQMAARGLSPSALNTFIRCSLKFYLEKVARLREAEEVEETIEASTLGNVVHGVLEDLYFPLTGQVVKPEHISAMQDQVEAATIHRFRKHYPDGEITSGKNLLLFNLAKRYVENFLKAEASLISNYKQRGLYLTILNTEGVLQGSIQVMADGEWMDVTIAGKADRIDRLGSTVRVVDYKTGKVEASDLKIKSFDELVEDVKYEKAFQVQAYAWLYRQMNPDVPEVESGIFSMRNLKPGFLKSEVDASIIQEGVNPETAFQEQLEKLVSRMLEPEEPFMQTPNEDNCKYCPFQALCGRFES